jgi:hypothetical protein
MQFVGDQTQIKYLLFRPDDVTFTINNHKASPAYESPFVLSFFSSFLGFFFHYFLSVGFSLFDTLSFRQQAQEAFDQRK